jgi:SsrA-binding protein
MKLVSNKKYGLIYTATETLSAGIELFGHEVKTLRSKLGSLDGAKVIVRGGEAFLVGVYIPPYQIANTKKDYDPYRTRRLLLSKAEIAHIAEKEQSTNLTTHPISLYLKNNLIKCELALSKKLQKHDKRELIKKDITRREMRQS